LGDGKTTKPHQELKSNTDCIFTQDDKVKSNQELNLNTFPNLREDKTLETTQELDLNTDTKLTEDETVKTNPQLNLNTNYKLRQDKTVKSNQELNLDRGTNLRDDETVKINQELNLDRGTNLRENETTLFNQELELNTVSNLREDKTLKINDTLKLNTDYILIENDGELKKEIALRENEPVLGIDTETTGLNPHIHKIRLIQIASPNYPIIIIDCFKCGINAVKSLLKPLLLNSAIKIFHNAKFDLQFFLAMGLEINQKIFDTQIAYQLIIAGNEGDNHCSLKSLVFELLNIELNKDEQVSDWSKDTLSPNQLTYSAKDVEVLLPLRDKLKLALNQFDLNRVAKIEFDCIHAVAMMEFNGMLLNLEQWQKSIKDTETKKALLEQELQQLLALPSEENTLFKIETKIDLNSPKQVKEALNNLGINIESTAFNTLSKLAPDYEVIRKLLEYRKLTKLLTSFGDNLTKKINPITGRLHPSLWQCGSSSGRFSCSNPNLQQIPRSKEIRSCFIASPGQKLVIADYSQIELRIAAEFANDSRMIDAYQRGEDLHKLTASLILNKPIEEVTKEDRQIAKSANFGLIYGSSVKGFRSYAESNYGIKLSEKEATKLHSNFFKAYQGLAKWHKQTKSRLYNQRLRETRTFSNRRRLFENPTPQQILNTPVQGTGADMLKLALAKLPLALKDTGALIIGTVHDEIILECPEDSASQVASILSEIMENSGRKFLTKVPVIAEATICDNWSEK
jgi:DNA polymerase I-like protein with 3'-5' exonuclease and polymerase domains